MCIRDRRSVVTWIPALNLNLTFRIDGFAWLFVTLVLGIGLLVVLYARYYLSKSDPVPRLYCFLLAFTGAMVGMLVSGNIIMLVVFWELTSVVSVSYTHLCRLQSCRQCGR